MGQPSDSLNVAVFPPALFGGTLVAGLLLHWSRPVPVLPPVAARLLGIVLFALSYALAGGAEGALKRAGTNVRPDHPTLTIVTDGPFRFTRNPLCLAATGIYAAVALLFNALWPLVLLIPMVAFLDWGVIRREER